MVRTIVATLAILALTCSCADSQTSAPNALAQVSADWARNWEGKKLDAVLALYTDDAVFMDADGSRVAGKPALRKFFAKVLQQYTAHPSLRSVNNLNSGDLGYDWGDYTETVTPLANSNGAIRASGTYLVVLRRASGRWLISEQMWTGNVPVPVKR